MGEETDDVSVSSAMSITLPDVQDLFADLVSSSSKDEFIRVFKAGIDVFSEMQSEERATFIKEMGDYIIGKIGNECDFHHEAGRKSCRHFFSPSGCNYEERNGHPCGFSHKRVCK